jgi:hypothetical protein
MPIIPTLGKLRQEDFEFKTKLSYMAIPCLNPVPNEKKT